MYRDPLDRCLAADSDLWSPGVLVLVDSTLEKKTEKDVYGLVEYYVTFTFYSYVNKSQP